MKISAFLERLRHRSAPKGVGSHDAPASRAPSQREPYVYVTKNGKRFHYDLLCPGIRNAKEIKMDLSKARKAGYTACDKCCFGYLHDDT